MLEGRPAKGFIGYPTAQAHNIPHEAAPSSKNPVIRGIVLYYLSLVVLSIPLIPSILWSNAGFNALRKRRELDHVDPRYDPTVIPLPSKDSNALPDREASGFDDYRLPKADTNGRFYTILDFHDAYKNGRVNPTDVIDFLLPIIRRDIENRAPHSTAFVDTKVEFVRSAAAASTKRWNDGKELGILDGVPFAVKDEMDVQGYKRFCGTKKDYTKGKEVNTSWCVKQLEEKGAVMVGKLNMHEFGMDTTNNNPNWGTPLNPYNAEYYTGGSSGGAAYVVSSGIVPFAIGSDGGGSIRIPSNYCGIYGLKPSHGRVSIAPTQSIAKTTAVHGPLAANMADLEIAYRVLAQPDPGYPGSSQFSPPAALSTPRKKILGFPKVWFDRADAPIQEACLAAIEYLKSELDYEVIDISMPLVHEGQIAHAMTILAEATTAEPDISHLTPANKILLKVAQQTPATDFIFAQRLRNLLMQHLAHLFQTHPGLVIVTPTTPNAGWPIGNGDLEYGVSDGNTQIRNMEYVWLANFTGIPCIQFPVAYVEATQGAGKIPVGLSGHGEWGTEDALIDFGHDGQAWLDNGYKGGRQKPRVWVDPLAGATAK